VAEPVLKERDWPKRANTLSNRLKRAAPPLRKIGIEITSDRTGHQGTKMITLSVVADKAGKRSSASPAPSAIVPNSPNLQGTGAPDLRTMTADADDLAGSAHDHAIYIDCTDASQSAGADDADDDVQGFVSGWRTRI
jgi:hypothetical protein